MCERRIILGKDFKSLDVEKRYRIINEALQEFTIKGFKNASTNEIVKKAKVSKGALFHHFPTKQTLFESLYNYSMDVYMESLGHFFENMDDDIFARWISFAKVKLELVAKYPSMSDFVQRSMIDDDEGVQLFLKNELSKFSKIFSTQIFEGINTSKFRKDVDIKKAMQMLTWVLEGFANTWKEEIVDFSGDDIDKWGESLLTEFMHYINLLKISFYKEEFHHEL